MSNMFVKTIYAPLHYIKKKIQCCLKVFLNPPDVGTVFVKNPKKNLLPHTSKYQLIKHTFQIMDTHTNNFFYYLVKHISSLM